MLKFHVKNQRITWVNKFNRVIEKSNNYLKASFSFSREWDSVIKTAIFKKDSLVKYVILENDECVIPSEMIQTQGEFEVSVIGGDLITVNSVTIEIEESIYTPSDSPEPSNDVYVEIISKVEELAKILIDAKTRYECLANVFDTMIINAGSSNAEIVQARIDAVGRTYISLKERLDYIQKDMATSSEIEEFADSLDLFTTQLTALENATTENYTDKSGNPVSNVFNDIKERLDSTSKKLYDLTNTVQDKIINIGDNVPEVVEAREDITGTEYSKLSVRLAMMESRELLSIKQSNTADMNTFLTAGNYYFGEGAYTNMPTTCKKGILLVISQNKNSECTKQIFCNISNDNTNNDIYIRGYNGESFTDWAKVITSGDYLICEVDFKNMGNVSYGNKVLTLPAGYTNVNTCVISVMYKSTKGWEDFSNFYAGKFVANIYGSSTNTQEFSIGFTRADNVQTSVDMTMRVVFLRLSSATKILNI